MGKGQKRQDNRSGKEHKPLPENVKGKVNKSEVSPSEPDISPLDYQEEIKKLQEEVTKLQEELRNCRTTCLCHGKKGNMCELNQMELDGHGHALEEAGRGLKEGGARRKELQSNYRVNKGKNTERRTKQDSNNTGSKMDFDDHGHGASESGAHRMENRTMQYRSTQKTKKETQAKCEDLANNEHASFDDGACSTEYQEHQIQRTIYGTAGSKSADQNIEDIVKNWEDWEDLVHQGSRDEDTSPEVSNLKDKSIPSRHRDNVTGVNKHWEHGHKDDKNSNRRKESWRTGDLSSGLKEREENKRKREQHEGNLISEINGDLFTAPEEFSLAHCVAEDLCMGSGIAVSFKQKFKRVDELADQRKRVGHVAVLEDGRRYIYYLITKKHSTGKPRILDLEKSLYEMKQHIVAHNVQNLAIPRIGCGLDRLDWKQVREMLKDVFSDVDLKIVVYNFTVDMDHPPHSKIKLRVKEEKMKLVNIGAKTILVLFGTASGDVDETMKDMDNKFSIMSDYQKNPRKLGDVIEIYKRNESLCILIVKEKNHDALSYSTLMECLKKLLKYFRDWEYYYMGFEAFVDNDDDLTTCKIINLFKILFARTESELWVCWPPKLEHIYEESKSLYTSHQYRDHHSGSYHNLSFK